MALNGQNDGVTVGQSNTGYTTVALDGQNDRVTVGQSNTGYSGSRWTERRGNCGRE